MEDAKALEVLKRVGDPIEKHIAQHAGAIPTVIYPYAGIWAEHVLIRRKKGDPSYVSDDWMLFAGSHYTALIRVFHAFRKYEAVISCCHAVLEGDRSPELLLAVHDAVAGFWEHIGSAIDNLGLCFEDAPCIAMGDREGCKYIQKNYALLDYAFDRRTQLIHSRLIPKGIDEGILFFNERLLDRKGTNWREQVERRTIVEDYFTDWWHKFLKEIGDVWQHLRNWLRNEDGKRPVVHELQIPTFDPEKQLGVLTGLWGNVDAPSTIKLTDPRDALRCKPVPPLDFPDVPPSGTR